MMKYQVSLSIAQQKVRLYLSSSRVSHMPKILELQEISKNFGGIQALYRISLSLNEGEVVGLIGPNGAGKTTLFNTICGTRPSEGSIFFKGEDITGLKSFQICRKGIARTFQLTRPFLEYSAQDNVAFALLFARNRNGVGGLREAREAAIDILRMVNLEHKAGNRAEGFGFGERRRLELARAVATGPQLLMMDEVMSGLSVSEGRDMLAIVNRLRSGGNLTIFVIEHIMKMISSLCERVIVLNYGKKLTEGPPSEVLRNKEVIAAYLGGEDAGNQGP